MNDPDREYGWMTDDLPCRRSALQGDDLWFQESPLLKRRARLGCASCPKLVRCASFAAGQKYHYATIGGVSLPATGGVHPGLTEDVLRGLVRDRREMARAASRVSKNLDIDDEAIEASEVA